MPVLKYRQLTASHQAGGSSANTASVAPKAGRPVIVTIGSARSGGGNTPTISGLGITWELIATRLSATHTDHRITSYFGYLPTTPTPSVIAIDFAGQSQNQIYWSVTEVYPVKKRGGVAAAILNNASGDSNTALSTYGLILAAAANRNNAIYAAIYAGATIAINEGAEFTELSLDAGSHTLQTEISLLPQTLADWNWTLASFPLVALAFEIKAAPQGGAIITAV